MTQYSASPSNVRSSQPAQSQQADPAAIQTKASWSRMRDLMPEHLEKAMIDHYIDSLEVKYSGDTLILEVPNVNYYQGFVDHILPVLNKVRADIKAKVHFT
ncbi:MAG: hypothetical protein OXC40_07065, partial [Proteobacteria bacterium]|nr:hypothetical protein [Pseudomonadota bacterium]